MCVLRNTPDTILIDTKQSMHDGCSVDLHTLTHLARPITQADTKPRALQPNGGALYPRPISWMWRDLFTSTRADPRIGATTPVAARHTTAHIQGKHISWLKKYM